MRRFSYFCGLCARTCFLPSGMLAYLFVVASTPGLWGFDLQADAQLLQKKPDVTLTGNYDINARPQVLDALLKSPILVAKLWEAYDFTPRYKVRMQGNAIHVDDPTGIQGDLYPVEQGSNRSVWVGIGNLNHKLVPSFRGRMALVLTMAPKGSGIAARVDLFIRTESRALGLLASTFFPLVKSRVQKRITANAADIGTILQEVSSDPQKAAARLSKEDAADLLRLISPSSLQPHAPKPAAPAQKKPPSSTPAVKSPPKKSQ